MIKQKEQRESSISDDTQNDDQEMYAELDKPSFARVTSNAGQYHLILSASFSRNRKEKGEAN